MPYNYKRVYSKNDVYFLRTGDLMSNYKLDAEKDMLVPVDGEEYGFMLGYVVVPIYAGGKYENRRILLTMEDVELAQKSKIKGLTIGFTDERENTPRPGGHPSPEGIKGEE